MADPPTIQPQTFEMQTLGTDPLINEAAPTLGEVVETVARLSGGKTPRVCNISVELLKGGDEAMTSGLHPVLTAVWQSF